MWSAERSDTAKTVVVRGFESFDIALAMETAHKDAAELQLSASNTMVHKVRKSTNPKPPWKQQNESSGKPCLHCRKTNHESGKFRLKNAVCKFCNKKGHIKKICLKFKNVHTMQEIVQVINSVRSQSEKITITPRINGVEVPMELNTVASVTLMSSSEFKTVRKKEIGQIRYSSKNSGDVIGQEGTIMVNVCYNGQSAIMKLCVVKGDGPAPLGTDWLKDIKLDWDRIVPVHSVTKANLKVRLKSILDQHKIVFSDSIGKVKGLKAKLTLRENAQPKFVKARTVPYSLQPKIEKELNNLESQGIITKVDSSEWATPIVREGKCRRKNIWQFQSHGEPRHQG